MWRLIPRVQSHGHPPQTWRCAHSNPWRRRNMHLGEPTSRRNMKRRDAVCRGFLYTLAALVLTLVVGYVAWRESERTRFARLDSLITHSYKQQSSFKFSSKMIVWLNASEPITSIEYNEGVYAADGKHGYIVHEITKTRVENMEGKKNAMMTAERLMGGGDDWIRYHSIEPKGSADDPALGIWQDTADLMDAVLANLTQEEEQTIVSQVSESLENGNPLADPGMVFSILKPELTRWVTPPYQKENLWCCNVLVNPRILLDDDMLTFDFTGPGIGLSSLENIDLHGVHLHSEYCWTSNNLLATMITEANKSGPDGFDFRKEVDVFQYNTPVEMPVPSHDNCQIEVRSLRDKGQICLFLAPGAVVFVDVQGDPHLHQCTWLT